MSGNTKQSVNDKKYISIPLAKGNSLNDEKWMIAGVPLGDGNFWMYEDKNARVTPNENGITIDISRFSSKHNQVQIFDNPKQLFLTKDNFKAGANGSIGFNCEMKADIVAGDINDYRDGFGAFNVLDFATGMVFDIITNGTKSWVIYERLFMPGVTTEDEAFTKVIDASGMTNGDFSKCRVVYSQPKNQAEYYLNDKLVYTAENIPVKIESLVTGFGFITFHPIANGKSVSCKGQGGRGAWRNFEYFAE